MAQYTIEEIYAGDKGPAVKILIATLENSAGLLGAAALWMWLKSLILINRKELSKIK